MRNANAIAPGRPLDRQGDERAAAAIALLQRLVAELSDQRIAGCRFAVPGRVEPCADGQPSFFWPELCELVQEAQGLQHGEFPPAQSAPARVRLVLVGQPPAGEVAAGGEGGRP